MTKQRLNRKAIGQTQSRQPNTRSYDAKHREWLSQLQHAAGVEKWNVYSHISVS